MVCPVCEGKKEIIGLFPIKVDSDPPECFNPPIKSFPCFFCEGTGEVDDRTPQWILAGRELRDMRWHAGLSLREASKKLEIDVALLSSMETGRTEPNMDLLMKYPLPSA